MLQIVQRYDILLIQEVRDKSETSIDILVAVINIHIGLVLNIELQHLPHTPTSSHSQFFQLFLICGTLSITYCYLKFVCSNVL